MDFVLLCAFIISIYIVYVIKLSNECKKRHKYDIFKYHK